MHRVAILSTGRQDFGILRSTLDACLAADDFAPLLLVGGMHLSARFGNTVDLVRADYDVDHELPFLAEPPHPLADTSGALRAVGEVLEAGQPDALVLVGDRSETLAAGLAATLSGVPVVHLHGGEESEGAIDNAMRHALTKLAHLHLVSHPEHARRVRQMGEDPARVVVVGAPGLDNAYRPDLPDRAALEASIGGSLADPVVLVTVQPETLGASPQAVVAAVTSAMERVRATYVVTLPNADEGGEAIRSHWAAWAPGRDGVMVVEALGETRYWGLLPHVAAVLGNSSAGIIEAPSLGIPSVNVGSRQAGRLRQPAVRDVASDGKEVTRALRSAVDEGRGGSRRLLSGYPAGPAAPRVLAALRQHLPITDLRKPFHDRPPG